MAEDGNPSLSADRPSDRDAEPLGHGALPQLEDQELYALQEVRAQAISVETADIAKSQEGTGTASGDEV